MASLSLGLSWGRSGFGPGSGFVSRYVTLAVPTLCCIYFIWELYGGRASRQFAQMTLFAFMCILLLPNSTCLLGYWETLRQNCEAFEQDLRDGVPFSLLYDRHHDRPPLIAYQTKETVQRIFLMLQRANVGRFQYLRLDSPSYGVSVPAVPVGLNQMTWDGGEGRGAGIDPYAVFALRKPIYVYEFQLKYRIDSDKTNVPLRIFWKRNGRNDFSPTERNVIVNAETGKQNTTTIPVNDTIDRYRIDLEDPTSALRISEIVLLPPPARGQGK
jgi:hypothetical protein